MEQKNRNFSKSKERNNLAFRIIPCLDVKNGSVVKGVNFVDLQDVGNPVAIAKAYNDKGADEIVFLDITASSDNRSIIIDMVRSVAKEIFIPFTVGGGVRNLDDIYALLNAGCDKVSINSAAIKNPSLIEEGAKRFGSQCMVVAIDYKKIAPQSWSVFINGGRIDTGKDLPQWCKEAYERGAGEILLTSMDNDGMKNGYDREGLQCVSKMAQIPIIASGGAGKMQDFLEIFNTGADAALAASIFHYNEITISDLKQYLADNAVPIRL